VFVPNAFVVGGANPVFQPVVGFVDIRNYRLEIMNRWGQVIWHTSDPYQGWDGRVDGHPAPIGVYAYHVQVINGAGRLVDRRGSVTLLTAVE
jgi:gliding motility-associated-like protein